MPEVVYMEPLCSLLGISVNELLAGERIPILDLLKKMDETRIELVTQLAYEQLKLRIFSNTERPRLLQKDIRAHCKKRWQTVMS